MARVLITVAVFDRGVCVHAVNDVKELSDEDTSKALRRGWGVLAPEEAAPQGNGQGGSQGGGGAPVGLDTLTVVQLKEQLDARGVEYSPTAKKAELVELLKNADEG